MSYELNKFNITCNKCNSNKIRFIKLYDFGYCDNYDYTGEFGMKCMDCNCVEHIKPKYETLEDIIWRQNKESK